jgi:hypothetical protein
LSYWYLASPYSKYEYGIVAAWEDICEDAGLLIKAGVPVYSPIAHTHPIAVHADIDPYAHDIWLPADAPLMEAAHGLIVNMMPGWKESYGISVEIKAFEDAGKPIIYMSPGIVPEQLLCKVA